MLSPRSVHLSIADGELIASVSGNAPLERYVAVMRVLQERTGRPPRSVLSNTFPVVVTSDWGALSTARMSGTPHAQRPEHEPIVVHSSEQVLCLQRGDLVMAQVSDNSGYRRVYLAATYDIAPRLLASRDPIIAPLLGTGRMMDADATRLLDIAMTRELTHAEQYFAAVAMPSAWKLCGGPPTRALTEPSPADVKQCIAFAGLFSDPQGKLSRLAATTQHWHIGIAGPTRTPAVPGVAMLHGGQTAPRFRA